MPVRLTYIEAPEPLAIDYRPVASLIPYARNARTHSEAQVALIAGSIREYGFTNPVLVDGDNGIIAGHGRVLAARKLGLAPVPVIELGHLSESAEAGLHPGRQPARRAGRLGPGAAGARGGGPQRPGRRPRLPRLRGGGDRCSAERRRRRPARGGDAGAAGRPVSQPGDLWLLGRHRLLCGSATDPADVARLLGGVRPHLMATDPPYGVSYDPAWRNRGGAVATKRTGKVMNDDRADWREAWALFPGEVAYVWHGALHATTVAESLDGLRLRDPSRRSSGRRSGWCSPAATITGSTSPAGTRCARRARATGPATASNRRSGRSRAATRMPRRCTAPRSRSRCMRRPMLNNSAPGQPVYEPFSGSGTIDHRCRDLRPDQPLDGARPGLRRCRGHAMADLHRRERDARRRRPQLRRDRRREGAA